MSDLARLVDDRRAERADDTVMSAALARAGFRDPPRALDALDLLLERAPSAIPVPEFADGAARSADPDRALLNLTRLLARPDAPRPPVAAADLAAFVGASQHMAELLVANPDLVARLGRPFDDAGALERYREAATGDDREARLRRAQQDDLMSIAWHDLVEDMDVELVTAQLSRLADASVAGAAAGLDAHRWFAVIALGKLGGGELNYSSDIDLLFVRADDVQDQVSSDRIARELVALVGRQTPEGHLYRVDMRLRPEGHTGVLTRTVGSCLDYYRAYGRAWERQMLLKARVLCDTRGAGRAFVERAREWIVACGLDAGAIRQFKLLKTVSERHHAGGKGGVDVKHQPGGIRDIETLVQFLSLLHATHDPSLLDTNTLRGLERLRVAGAIGSLDAARLRTAYRFHRKVENRLQVMHRVQTHQLPTDLLPLARLMRKRDAATFEAEFEEHRARVREIFDRLVSGAFASAPGPGDAISDLLLGPAPDREEATRVLGGLGFRDPEGSLAVLQRAAAPISRFLPSSPRLVRSFASVAPALLDRLALSAQPDSALDRFERITRGVGAREVLYALAEQDPSLLEMLCDLAVGSPYLCDVLIQEPHLVDAFTDALLTGSRGQVHRRERLERLHRAATEDPWLVLSDHRKVETLRIGVNDLQGRVPTRTTLADLSHLCIDVLRHAFELVMSAAVREHGAPTRVRGMSLRAPADMAVVALGKLGGLEANYGSDADLIFVSSGPGQTESGLSNDVFFSRVAETFIARVGGKRDGPRLYKIDTRLRPEGAKGPLVTTLRQLTRYFGSERASLFERMALLKARVVAGDAELGQEVLKVLRDAVRSAELPDDFPAQMRAMRARIEKSAHGHDLKRGSGGMVDVEFLVQALQLRHGRRKPAVLVPETARALEALATAGVLPTSRAHRLRDTYLLLRRVETRLQLALGSDTKEIPSDPDAARELALRLGYADTSEGDAGHLLRTDLEERAEETRTEFEALLA